MNKIMIAAILVFLLAGCSWVKSKLSNSSTSQTVKASEIKQETGSPPASLIEGAYGWKLGEIAPNTIECKVDQRRCGLDDVLSQRNPLRPEMGLELLGCEVKGRDATPDGWEIKICIAPKSRTIHQIVVITNGIDSSTQTALKRKIIEKYGGGKSTLLDTVFESGENTLTLREDPSGSLLFYTSTSATILTAKEHEEIKASDVKKAEDKIKVDGL